MQGSRLNPNHVEKNDSLFRYEVLAKITVRAKGNEVSGDYYLQEAPTQQGTIYYSIKALKPIRKNVKST